jgi:predicted AlkP superfamily phosphohydrolase/phosphomutase
VVLGFDGLDPDLVEEMWTRGELPNLRTLAAEGTFSRLRSTSPPQSPVAWATFATGTLPGKHGVFDFVVREPARYLPKQGAVEYLPPPFDALGNPAGPASGRNLRRGDSFWLRAAQAGLPVRVLNVPYAWPPDPMPDGSKHASGLGIPDLRLTNSTGTVWSSDWGGRPPDPGGVRAIPIEIRDGVARSWIEGPRCRGGEPMKQLVRFTLVHASAGGGPAVRIASGADAEGPPDGGELVAAGGWSAWRRFEFGPPGGPVSAAGRSRFYVESATPERLRVYLGPLGAEPAPAAGLPPFVPLSAPPLFASELDPISGTYKTVGWEEDTSVLNAGLLPDAAFLDETWSVMEQRAAQALSLLDDGAPLVVAAWTGTDRVQHMFWRLRDPASPMHDSSLAAAVADPIAEAYRRADAIVGRVRAALLPGTTLLILSDHGFHAWNRGLHVNRWLLENGYLALKAPSTSTTAGTGGPSPFGGARPQPRPPALPDVDWSRTRAYSLGTGQIYLNLRGREGQGIVSFGSEREALLAEIREKLLQVRDPADGSPVLRDVVPAPSGPAAALAPDLQLAFAPGWQTSWETKLGGVPDALFADNDRRWSGDHAASLAAETEGVLFVSRKLPLASPGIEDIAPTVLKGLGLAPPPDSDGRPLW